MKDVIVVGAGLSGAVISRTLAERGLKVTVCDSRLHVAGNCHTVRDRETGVMVHEYGPHIFHTDDEEVWKYVNAFADFKDYVHRVKVTSKGNVYSLPINLHTINQKFGFALRPDQAIDYIQAKLCSFKDPKNLEEHALSHIGSELYYAFFAGYTEKQWGRNPSELPASVIKRLPVRFNYDDAYFSHKFQGIPVGGYTQMVSNILNFRNIKVELGRQFSRDEKSKYSHVFFSGPIDGWFDYRHGRLPYRTLDFDRFTAVGDWQGCAVMNFADIDIPYTRITEHKHFAPWESHSSTVLFREYSRECLNGDIPFYPTRLSEDTKMLKEYLDAADREDGVTFVGRLGTYRYLDMDVTIREALDSARAYLAKLKSV